ncbi:unnamed protein product [Pedinophyceae sp. YPF-701]|nr:unnamed protein product [Pedinophyceae sp. YPF-701]
MAMIAARASLPVAKPTVAARNTRSARRAVVVKASAEKKVEKVAAAVIASTGAVMANPLVAEAAVTPSLKNLLNSVVAGGVVLIAIAGAVTAVSSFDQLDR